MSRPTILLADDHALIIDGITSLLAPDFEIVGTVNDGRALVAAALELKPDVIIADIGMPRMNGLEAAAQIRKAGAAAKIIFLTMYLDIGLATQGLRLGASGYVLKSAAPDELRTAIDAALDGGTFVSSAMGSDLLRAVIGPAPVETKQVGLTARQREVLQLLAEGFTSREIAGQLGVSKATVEFHKARLKRILGLDSIAELTQYAVHSGIITKPSSLGE